MSRWINQSVSVVTDSEGVPRRVDGAPVLHVHSFHREWIGALEGEPERDVWRLELPCGIVELHRIETIWLLARWED